MGKLTKKVAICSINSYNDVFVIPGGGVDHFPFCLSRKEAQDLHRHPVGVLGPWPSGRRGQGLTGDLMEMYS